MSTTLAVVGIVDAIPTHGICQGTAAFDLIHFPDPADNDGSEPLDIVYSCTTADPRIVDVLLNDIHVGDLVRITGTAVQPTKSSAPIHFTIDALEILQAVPAPMPHDLVLERRGRYVALYSASCDTVPIFTTDGTWVGSATSPDTVAAVVQSHQGGD